MGRLTKEVNLSLVGRDRNALFGIFGAQARSWDIFGPTTLASCTTLPGCVDRFRTFNPLGIMETKFRGAKTLPPLYYIMRKV
jgi:uncharacterized membrane protein YeiH